MRALFVSNMYPPHHLGGYELVCRSAAAHVRDSGDAVGVLTTDFRHPEAATLPEDPDVRRELRWYWRDHRFPRLSPAERLRLERHNAAALDRCLAELRPDVVAWWAMGGMSLSLIARVREAGLPSVAFVHDDWLLYGPRVDAWMRMFSRRRRWRGAARRRTGIATTLDTSDVDRWVFVSDFVRRRAEGEGLAFGRVQIASSGIHPGFLEAAPERPWSWRLLYVGRIDERKGIDVAIDALSGLPDDARLTVVGKGDERHLAFLRAHAAGLGVTERVEFAPAASREQLQALYAEHDAVVFPARWEEPWGLVPLEAMARGRPVVATARGGSAEYLRDGQNCLVVTHGDPRGLSAALRRLAGDEALRAALRRGGQATAAQHTETRFNEAVLAALRAPTAS